MYDPFTPLNPKSNSDDEGIEQARRGLCGAGNPVASSVQGFASNTCKGYTKYCERCEGDRRRWRDRYNLPLHFFLR